METLIIIATSLIALLSIVHGGLLLLSNKYYLWLSNNFWQRKGTPSHQIETKFMDRWWRGGMSVATGIVLVVFLSSVLL